MGTKSFNLMGVVTVGERGQIVIPTNARTSAKIKAGDKLLVFSGPHEDSLIVATTETFDRISQHMLGRSKDLAKKITEIRKSIKTS